VQPSWNQTGADTGKDGAVAIITISRGSLSGGKALADCLSKRLGYPTLGREVLQEAAESVGVSEEAFRGKFETTPGIWARITQQREKYILAVQTALAEWCTRGDLIYHGLAGQFLLQDLSGVLRIRLMAPTEKRIEALSDSLHRMSPEQAEDFIENVDRERARWVRVMYGVDVNDASLYDLTLNLRTLSLDSACETVVAAVEQPRFQISEEAEAECFSFAAECRARLNRITGG
jgi:cytidylate kinase